MLYLLLYWEFFKIGLFTIGGGLATIPFLYQMSVNFPTWITSADVADMIAISQSTPGPMGINMATYTGFKTIGIFGGLTATIGLVTPSVIIIVIIAKFLTHFDKQWYVKNSFYGLRPTVLALICFAVSNIFVLSLYNGSSIRITESVIFIIVFFLYRKLKKIHPVVWIVIGAILGIVLKLPT